MSDLIGNTAESQTIGSENLGEVAAEGSSDQPSIADIKREYFPPANLAAAQDAIQTAAAACAAIGKEPTTNFNFDDEFPAGYGIAIIPTRGRVGGETITTGCTIGAVPDPDKIANSEGGPEFIAAAILDKVIAKLANSVRPKGEAGTIANSLPFSVHDFITSSKGAGEGLATFRKLAPVYVKGLKEKGLTFMSGPILRQILSSAAFAGQHWPKTPQTVWASLLDKMIVRARNANLDPAVLQTWKDTRDAAEVEVAELDLNDFDDIA